MSRGKVVIVDYGLGNLFSVQRALTRVGALDATISCERKDIETAERIILPGVGAFGDGMKNLHDRNLVPALQEFAESGRPLLGVCLGMQLILSNSEEFGFHDGLNIIPGSVRRLDIDSTNPFKIPHIGWNTLQKCSKFSKKSDSWNNTMLQGIQEGASMYFNHSFIVEPEDPGVELASTNYANNTYCSVMKQKNVTGAQFHPELSGEDGLKLYSNFLKNP